MGIDEAINKLQVLRVEARRYYVTFNELEEILKALDEPKLDDGGLDIHAQTGVFAAPEQDPYIEDLGGGYVRVHPTKPKLVPACKCHKHTELDEDAKQK